MFSLTSHFSRSPVFSKKRIKAYNALIFFFKKSGEVFKLTFNLFSAAQTVLSLTLVVIPFTFLFTLFTFLR